MTITVPVAIPDPSLPLADPADRATFTPRKLEHLRWERENLAPGVKALGDASFNNATDAQASATAALASKNAAALSEANAAATANFKGLWSSLTGALNKPATVSHNGTIWALLNNLANVALSQPGVTADWVYVSGSGAPYTVTTALVTQAVAGGRYALTNATAQPAATNGLVYSNSLANAAWGKTGSSAIDNSTMADDGTTTMGAFNETAVASEHSAFSTPQTIVAASVNTVSINLKAGARSFASVRLASGNGSFSVCFAIINLATGAITSSGVAGAGAVLSGVDSTPLGNGIYRLTVAGSLSATVTLAFCHVFVLLDATTFVYPGAASTGIFAGNAQLETGTTPSSYIQTTSAPVTRTAGVIAPQRIILPASPATNTQVDVVSANTVDTNVIDPNGQQFYGTGGPLAGAMRLDSQNANVKLQFINGFWRSV